jgi:hypothetical protein
MEEIPGRLFRGTFFQLIYPAEWEMEIIEDIPAFYDPLSGGVLQCAASRNPDGPFDLPGEMRKFLERQQIAFEEDSIARFRTPGGQDCIACEYTREDRFWMVYMIALEDRLLIVMYNADEIPGPDQARSVSDVIASIRFLSE